MESPKVINFDVLEEGVLQNRPIPLLVASLTLCLGLRSLSSLVRYDGVAVLAQAFRIVVLVIAKRAYEFTVEAARLWLSTLENVASFLDAIGQPSLVFQGMGSGFFKSSRKIPSPGRIPLWDGLYESMVVFRLHSVKML